MNETLLDLYSLWMFVVWAQATMRQLNGPCFDEFRFDALSYPTYTTGLNSLG